MQHMTIQEAKGYSSLTLAFLGDSIFEILVRQKIILNGDMRIDRLHDMKVEIVCATFQAKAITYIVDHNMLSEDELAVFKRGKNSKCHAPKSANLTDYRLATGLESLFGYLYLIGNEKRIDELFSIVWNIYKEDF